MGWNGSELSRAGAPRTPQGNDGRGRSPSAPNGTARGGEGSRRPTVMRGVIAGVLVAAIGAAVVWFVGGREATRPADGRDRVPSRSAVPAKPAKIAEVVNPLGKPAGRPKKEDLAALKPQTSGAGTVEKREDIPEPVANDEKKESAAPRRVFRNSVEQLLSMAFSDDPTIETPPLPIGEDEDMNIEELDRGLSNIIKAEEGDDDKILQRKLAVAEMKAEFIELEKEGWTFPQYVKELQRRNNDNAEFYGEACKVAEDAYHDSEIDDAGYLELRKQVNAKLKERGLPDLPSDDPDDDGSENDAGAATK